MENPKVLRRYTDTPALFYMLRKRCLTFLDPATWDDKNDVSFLQSYKERKGFSTLLALCFSSRKETYHHWHVFAGGSSGVCVHFDREQLTTHFEAVESIAHGLVEYPTENEVAAAHLSLDRLPFTKRHGYSDEGEYRFIYGSTAAEGQTKDFTIPLNYIRHIHVNPWINPSLFGALKDTIASIDGCSGIKVSKSSLVVSSKWQSAANGAA